MPKKYRLIAVDDKFRRMLKEMANQRGITLIKLTENIYENKNLRSVSKDNIRKEKNNEFDFFW